SEECLTLARKILVVTNFLEIYHFDLKEGMKFMKHRNLIVLMAFVLAVISLFGLNASAAENGSQNDDIDSVSDIKELVEQLVNEGEIESDQAVHALKLHLMAVAHFEKVNKKDKVDKHMDGFNNLLEYQKKEGQISDSAYQDL